jgi:hypothetical protein
VWEAPQLDMTEKSKTLQALHRITPEEPISSMSDSERLGGDLSPTEQSRIRQLSEDDHYADT